VNRVRRPPLQHRLLLSSTARSIPFALPSIPTRLVTIVGQCVNFLGYLDAAHPQLTCLDQLRRDSHTLGWMSRLRAQSPPLVTASYINLLIALRRILNELAWTEQLPQLTHLIRREDIPRLPRRLPRPLTTQHDQLLQQEFLRRNDLGANVFLLIRHTGMRIGECADLSLECLRSTGPDQWAIHVPLGKLKTERMVPVDPFVCKLVQRLRFFRSLDPLPADGRLLARPLTKEALLHRLRDYLHQVCHSLGLPTRIVPHQFRHYAGFRTIPGEVDLEPIGGSLTNIFPA
jgi:integrase